MPTLLATEKKRKVAYRLSSAFTLIELLVVMTIISLLVAAATVSWKNAQAKGRDSRRKADLMAIQQALEYYFNVNGKYPLTGGNLNISCNITADDGTSDTRVIIWGNEFKCMDKHNSSSYITYMKKLPSDPSFSDLAHQYAYWALGGQTYSLGSWLENSNDPDYMTNYLTNYPFVAAKRPYYVCEPTANPSIKKYCKK